MVRKSRKNYTNDYKREVVRSYVSDSCNMSEVAAHFGVTTSMLYKWHKRYGNEFRSDQPNLEAEVRKLAQELEKTQRDLDTLREIVRKKIVQHALSGTDRDLVEALLEH